MKCLFNMRLVIDSKFRHGSRIFIVTGIKWIGSPRNGIEDTLLFREVHNEPEPSHVIERDYKYMMDLLNKNIIIHL